MHVLILFAFMVAPGTCAAQPIAEPEAARDRIPNALLGAIAGRVSMRTAHIHYTHHQNWWDGLRQVEAIMEDRYAENGQLNTNFGNRDGFRSIGSNGRHKIGVVGANNPLTQLMASDTHKRWFYKRGHASFGAEPMIQSTLFDARIFGVFPDLVPGMTPEQQAAGLQAMAKHLTWEEEALPDGLTLVRGDSAPQEPDQHIVRYEWRIDPAKDDAVLSAVRMLVDRDGIKQIRSRTDTTYEQNADGVWFVKTLTWERSDIGTSLITIENATFNRPDHPSKVGPELMGIPVGTVNYEHSDGGPVRPPNRWNGQRLLTAEEWAASEDEFDTAEHDFLGSQPLAGTAPAWWHDVSGEFGLAGVEWTPGLWEDYVRRWCYKQTMDVVKPIDARQQAAAYAILKDCQEKAYPIFQRIEKDIVALDKELATLDKELETLKKNQPPPTKTKSAAPGKQASTDKGAAAAAARAADLTAKRAATLKKKRNLTAPIEAIFNNHLKPRLEALLRSVQLPDKPTDENAPPALLRRPGR